MYLSFIIYLFIFICWSGGWKCALVGVPWRGSVSAHLAWGDIVVSTCCQNCSENAEHSETVGHTYKGIPTTA